MVEIVHAWSRGRSECPKCSIAPRKSLSLTHGVPGMPQCKETSLGQTTKSTAFASAVACWRGHCCGGGGVDHPMRISSDRIASLLMVVALTFGLAACATAPRIQDGAALEGGALYPTLAENPHPTVRPYVIAVGDELAIKFYTNPEL